MSITLTPLGKQRCTWEFTVFFPYRWPLVKRLDQIFPRGCPPFYVVSYSSIAHSSLPLEIWVSITMCVHLYSISWTSSAPETRYLVVPLEAISAFCLPNAEVIIRCLAGGGLRSILHPQWESICGCYSYSYKKYTDLRDLPQPPGATISKNERCQ